MVIDHDALVLECMRGLLCNWAAASVMSGDTAPECLRAAGESGHHLLHKPVQPITLRAMVNRFLKSGHRL